MTLSKYLPGRPWIILIAFIGVIYGWLVATFYEDYKPALLRERYPDLSEKITLWDFKYFDRLEADGKTKIPKMAIFEGSLKVAFVAVLETLISARIADSLTGTRFNQSHETRGMGLANLLAGFMGGTPCTGVLIRTSVNCSSGANDMMS